MFDVALGAFFNVRLPLIPKQVSNSKFMSAIKKKVKKITIGSGKQKNTSKGVYDERLGRISLHDPPFLLSFLLSLIFFLIVISTPYSFAQYNRFGVSKRGKRKDRKEKELCSLFLQFTYLFIACCSIRLQYNVCFRRLQEHEQ